MLEKFICLLFIFGGGLSIMKIITSNRNVIMNRQIKFRGKDNEGEWIIGFLSSESTIISPKYHTTDFFDIDSKTIGEFTGEVSQGVDVYENDIIEISGSLKRLIVEFKNGCFYSTNKSIDSNYRLGGWKKDSYKVIGNIHENPELLTQ